MIFVDPPPTVTARFGLLEAATVVTGGDPHTMMGVQYQPVCGTAHLTVGDCFAVDLTESGESDAPSASNKTVDDGIPYVEGRPFAVYHLFACRPIGGGDLAARASASFELAEGMAVEEWFGDYLTDHPDAVDLTPAGGAVPVVAGLALLEGYAGANYGGAPVFHGDRELASLLTTLGSLTVNSGRLETGLGARFAAGGGYSTTLGDPGGGATAADEGWLYVTGPVGFWRGPVDSNSGFATSEPEVVVGSGLTAAIINDPRVGTAANSALNETRVLVERQYVGATSCIVAGVRVNRDACDCPEVLT